MGSLLKLVLDMLIGSFEDFVNELKQDFLDWSGGFKPQDDDQVNLYVKSSLSIKMHDEVARQALTDWMNQAEKHEG